jgi:hypothetical protein
VGHDRLKLDLDGISWDFMGVKKNKVNQWLTKYLCVKRIDRPDVEAKLGAEW